MHRIALAGALALALIARPAGADEARPVLRIEGSGDGGGMVEVYRTVLNFMRMLGARVELAAECTSACVMVLRAIPQERICVRPGAKIGLHLVAIAGPDGKPRYDKRVTADFVRRFYPAWIADWIAAHGPLKPKPVYVGYEELRKHYAKCP